MFSDLRQFESQQDQHKRTKQTALVYFAFIEHTK